MVHLYCPHENVAGQVYEQTADGILAAAANLTLTIVALAIRQADHIADRMARREL